MRAWLCVAAVTGFLLFSTIAQAAARAMVDAPPPKKAQSLRVFGIVLGGRSTPPACRVATGRHSDSANSRRDARGSCLEDGRKLSKRATAYRLHLGEEEASDWFPTSCTYTLFVLDGRVAAVSIKTGGEIAADDVVAILVRHYGKRHAQDATQKVSMIKGKFIAESWIYASWHFEDLLVRYRSHADVLTSGEVDLGTPKFDAWFKNRYH